jgi:uncharacterized protein (DUF305 family)
MLPVSRTLRRLALAAAVVALASPAAAQHAGHAHASPTHAADSVAAGEADAAFLRGMIAHHAQAVEMARLAAPNDASAGVRRLAERVLAGQEDEMGRMRAWLRARGLSDAGGHDDHAGMPGMLPPARLEALAAARGEAFDRLFLASMIEHHRGAVEMVRRLFATPGAGRDPALFRLASDVSSEQAAEIARMQRMLAPLVLQGPVAP